MIIKKSTIKNNFLILLFFLTLIISILSPIASNSFLPKTELILHTSGVIQAKMALDQGQFPIRTVPAEDLNWGNAWFQFYSPIPFTLGGAIYKWIFVKNPFFALKIVLALSMLFGAAYFYGLVRWLLDSEVVALLTSTVYLFSPYYLVNILARGDFTEAVAQGIIPVALYYSLRLYSSTSFHLRYFIGATIAWFMLAGTHIVTFIYSSLFIALFLILLTLKNRLHLKQLIIVGLSYFYAILLGLYYLAPIVLFQKYLPITYSFDNFSISSWLTSLPALLSFKALSPMPLPGNNLLGLPNLYFSVGLPILLGVGGIVYILYQGVKINNKNITMIIFPLLLLFFLAFFITWSPINFWIYLPKILRSAQFSYRLLTQVTWIGCLLFAIFISWTFHNKLDMRHGLLGLILIILCGSTWIPTQFSEKTVKESIANPDLGYGKYSYLTMPQAVGAHEKQFILPLSNTIDNCSRNGKKRYVI